MRHFIVLLVASLLSLGSSKVLDCLCGQQNIGSRIINGTAAAPNRYPWMVSVGSANDPDGHFCGGTLINSRWVLTAAHCAEGGDPKASVVILGAVKSNDQQNGKVMKLDKVIIHKGYTEGTGKVQKNDMALLRMTESVTFTRKISPVCLPRNGYPAFEQFDNLLAIGWGYNGLEGPEEAFLQEAEFNEVPTEKCKAAYPALVEKDMHICIRAPGKDVCYGDSGGPLTTNFDGSTYLVGVASFSAGCAGYLSGYSRVTSYLNWIRENAYDADFCKNPIIADMG